MTAHEPFSEDHAGAVVRRYIQATAPALPAPDFWPRINSRIAMDGHRKNPLPGLPVRWLAPAGTVAFIVAALAVWVMLLNNPDNAGETNQPGAKPTAPLDDGSEIKVTEVPVLDGLFREALLSLATAGPFRVEGELYTTSRQGGMMTTLPGAIDTPLTEDGRTLRDMKDTGDYPETSRAFQPEGGADVSFFNYLTALVELKCVERGADRICTLGPDETGPALAVHYIVGGTEHFKSVFVSPDLYRVERTLEIDPEFEAEVSEQIPDAQADLARLEQTAVFRQLDARFYDSSSPAVGGYGTITEGSVFDFLMLHLGPGFIVDGEPKELSDLVTFSNLREVSVDGSSEATINTSQGSARATRYRADISGPLGEAGTWEMWIGEDGLPRIIEIEAYNSPRWARHAGDDLEVTRVKLTFFGFGEPLDPDDPMQRLMDR